MASLSKDGAGWRIRFTCPATKKRRTIRTGKCSKKNADTALNMVERLIQSKRLGTALDGQTAEWLKGIDDTLRARLAKVDLIDSFESALLGEFIDGFIAMRKKRGDVVAGTLKVWGHTRTNLVDFFGADADIRTITPEKVDDWAAWMFDEQDLAENSVRKRSQFARMFFNVAQRRKLIQENPFANLACSVVPVKDRQFFVPRETVTRLLNQCNGVEFRLLLVFARYMGVRVPSEIVPLKWSDVNWENSTVVITSPKTKRHKGREQRVCPLFTEVLPHLQEAWEAAPEGSVHLFPSIRRPDKNLRSWLEKAILREGLEPWPRLWQNLRATRATELVDVYPSHVAASWLGHTETIANAHYRQVTAEHLQRATTEPTGPIPSLEESGPDSGPLTAGHGSSGDRKRIAPSQNPQGKRALTNVEESKAEVHGNRTHRPRGSRTAQRF